jgi:hypothetical protein
MSKTTPLLSLSHQRVGILFDSLLIPMYSVIIMLSIFNELKSYLVGISVILALVRLRRMNPASFFKERFPTSGNDN